MNLNTKIKRFKNLHVLIGKKLPTNLHGHAGRAAENILENLGITINRGPGPDLVGYYGVELKTRKISATSSQTVGSISLRRILQRPNYYDTDIYLKFRQQIRIKTNDDDIIVDVDLFDFDKPFIQEPIEKSFNKAVDYLCKNPYEMRTPYEGLAGFLEKSEEDSNSYDFRFSDSVMKKLERMAKSTYCHLFEELFDEMA